MNLEEYEAEFRSGDFRRRTDLAAGVAAHVEDLSSRVLYVYASVARHDDVSVLGRMVEVVETAEAAGRLAHCLGLTLSPRAIPFLLALSESFSELDLDEDVALGLDTVYPIPGLNGDSLRALGPLYSDIVPALVDAGHYYFRGEPFFVGSLTKQLVTMSVASVVEKRPLVLGYEQDVLLAATGIVPPVVYGDMLSERSLEDVYAYVERLARMPWTRGVKYYFGHQLE